MPEWARGQALWAQLQAQVKMDPDEIFQQHKKTCALNEVFGHAGALLCSPPTACWDEQLNPHMTQQPSSVTCFQQLATQ